MVQWSSIAYSCYFSSHQKALLTNDEVEKTAKLAAAFYSGRGTHLQSALQAFARDNPNTSYLSKMWLDKYLSDRRPLVVTQNPVMVFKDSERRESAYQKVLSLGSYAKSSLL